MEIKKAELREDGIHVEAELDGELFLRKFDQDKDRDEIVAELESSENNIKEEKKKKEEYKVKEEKNAKANTTIESLLSKN